MEESVKFGEHKLAGLFHPPAQRTSACVITCHGLLSSKDSEKYVEIARRFCDEGLAVLRFDFRGCGESKGELEETTLTERIEDLGHALDFVWEKGYRNVGVMGSSLGGCVSILKAAKDRRIKALVTWSTPYYLDELFGEIKGFQKLRQDIMKHNMSKALREIDCPISIVHGSSDEIVPLLHANALFKNADRPKNILIVEGADHRFTNPIHREKAVEVTLDWFKNYLK